MRAVTAELGIQVPPHASVVPLPSALQGAAV
jgi:hypothetical protein